MRLVAWPGVDLSWLFHAATPQPSRRHILDTLGQTAVFWVTFLLLIPVGLAALEDHAGISTWQANAPLRAAAIVVFLAGGALGIMSGITMARAGRGTPLPSACPARLVVAGPYRFVRNPMAIAGLVQGAAVGLWLGSPLVLLYVLAGAIVWHMMVRPLEEHDLAMRFGAVYERYRRHVRCWLPRRSAGVNVEDARCQPAPPGS
ncbi:MAG: isoprenylcysteine carboxylmethyltransferase family protein [Phycisphaeraceae bacterium]